MICKTTNKTVNHAPTICCCWGKGLNPAGVVLAIGGPRAGVVPNCLENGKMSKIFGLEAGQTHLLPPGPKLRLLARLARLESRSPVTSLLPEVSPGPELVIGDITAEINNFLQYLKYE